MKSKLLERQYIINMMLVVLAEPHNVTGNVNIHFMISWKQLLEKHESLHLEELFNDCPKLATMSNMLNIILSFLLHMCCDLQ